MAELGLAVIGTVDLCLRRGKEMHRLCSAFVHAESELQERSLRIESGWHRCATQLQFLQEAWEMMDSAHQDLQERTLHMFASKLNMATTRLQKVVTAKIDSKGVISGASMVPKPLKYALQKNSLDEAIEALEIWQRMSDPSWFLLFRRPKAALSNVICEDKQRLKESLPSVLGINPSLRDTPSEHNSIGVLKLHSRVLDNMSVIDLPHCSASVAKKTSSFKSFDYVLDHFDTPRIPTQQLLERGTRELAHKLRHAEPENFNLLQAKGFVVNYGDKPITLVFRAPDGFSAPRSLRYWLINNGLPDSLSHRFSIAQQLARAVSYVHVYGFVHKRISPENILLLDKEDSDVPGLFLVGLGGSRHGLQISEMQGDDSPRKNLYRHPQRQGKIPNDRYIMQHDIYSLGVCLLEIGLWTTFVDYDESGRTASLSSVFGLGTRVSAQEVRSFLISRSQDYLLELARTQLKVSMGSHYANITETCMRCLEPENNDFGEPDDFEDDLTAEEENQVGVKYIDKVLHQLCNLRV